jgi:hypothetical protein
VLNVILPHAKSGVVGVASGVLVPKLHKDADPVFDAQEPIIFGTANRVRNCGYTRGRSNRHITTEYWSSSAACELERSGINAHEVFNNYAYREAFAGIYDWSRPNDVGLSIRKSLEVWKPMVVGGHENVGSLVALHRVKLTLHNAQLTLEYQGRYDAYHHQGGSEPTYTGRPARNPPFINLVWGFVILAMTMLSVLMSQKCAEYAGNHRRLAPWWWVPSLAFLGLAF